MIYMRPWQLMYSIWYNRCIKLYHIFWSYHVYIYICCWILPESIMVSSLFWYQQLRIRFFVDRQNLLQDMPPSFAFLGVRRRVNPDERLEDLKMAISNVLFWMLGWFCGENWWWFPWFFLGSCFLIFLLICFSLTFFDHCCHHISLLDDIIVDLIVALHDVNGGWGCCFQDKVLNVKVCLAGLKAPSRNGAP